MITSGACLRGWWEGQMQAGYRIHAWGSRPVWEEFPVPEAAEGEVLVKVEACGVGLTVLNYIDGNLGSDPALLPRVPGHEYVGRVVSTGSAVDDWLVGRRVAAYFYLSCGRCPHCLAGNEPRCSALIGNIGVHRDGGYAPYAVLPSHNAIALPDGLDPVAATVIPDAVATPVHVGRRAGIEPGDRVAVVGAGGGVGIHMVQVAHLRGASVAGLDVTPEKLAAIEALGGTGIDSSDLAGLTSTLWGARRPTVVVDLVGSKATLLWGARALEAGGRLVVLTTFRDLTMTVDPRELVLAESSIIGSRYAGRAEVALAADLVHGERVQPVIGRTTGPDQVLAVHDQLMSGTLVGRAALSWSGSATARATSRD